MDAAFRPEMNITFYTTIFEDLKLGKAENAIVSYEEDVKEISFSPTPVSEQPTHPVV